jgi:hypothetical protein
LLAQVRGGPVDVVMLDYLAEITMSILRKQMDRDPGAGFARDFLHALAPALDDVVARGIQVVTNAGGINPLACARAVTDLLADAGHRGVKVGVVLGDDILGDLDALLAREPLSHLDTGAPLSEVRDRVLSANVYLGAEPIADALRRGAQIVITGRCVDPALVLGPLIAHFGWPADDLDRRAAGVVAGHAIECGAQVSGGNFAGGWPDVPDLARVGYPIAEVSADGRVVITKHPDTGGRVVAASVKEQLLYEIGDPSSYVTPDVCSDFTSIELTDRGDNRVALEGIVGKPPPERLKASLTYQDGWKNVVSLTFVWPHAIERAHATTQLLLERCRILGLHIEAHHTDLIGVSGAHGPMAPEPKHEPNEVLLRMAVRCRDRDSARRFAAEVSPLITGGVPGACNGNTSGRAAPSPIINCWPTLVPRDSVCPSVEIFES